MSRLLFAVVIFLSSYNLQAQYAVWGTVTNSYGEKMEGASVFIVNSDKATITDFEGYYSLDDLPSEEQVLKVTYLGYEDVTIPILPVSDTSINITLKGSIFQLEDIQITANRLEEKSPFSYQQQDKEDIQLKNLAQDLPYLLEHTPSMVVTSDAGAGIGYTGMRIRGSDATRINVTINGVPLNDSESHGVFWVDLPDFGTSVNSIQVQRGVGPSTNGSGAFGGTIGLNTNYIHQNPYVQLEGTYGSFNTFKRNMSFSTGLMNQKYSVEGRFSLIDSDGFIDRSQSDLSSWYFSVAKVNQNKVLRFNVFSGKERTNQAWNGVPEVKFTKGSLEELLEHLSTNSNGDYDTPADSINLIESEFNKYNAYTYPNQVDDYRQSHAQLVYAEQVSDDFKLNGTLHYTKGKGFFEQFRYQDDLCDYMPMDTCFDANIVRRRWLDNHFFGVILNGEIRANDQLNITVGLGQNTYLGNHFGQIISATSLDSIPIPGIAGGQEYYRSDATKLDLNAYVQANYAVNDKLDIFADLQSRSLSYSTQGLDSDRSEFKIDTSYNFFNPKLGLSYKLGTNKLLYLSYARAHREPVRSDFLDAVGVAVPSVEKLDDIELGLRGSDKKLSYAANFYYMKYKDQLVLTGAVNDVGAPVRSNVDNSYRAGVELSAQYDFTEYLSWKPNLTISTNKIAEFQEFVENKTFTNSDIAFSPSLIAGSQISYSPAYNLEISLLSKFVGQQYLDNTSNDSRSLPSYFVNDILASYTIETDLVQEIQFKVLINNILNSIYASNGYTYSYIWDGLVTENYVYPQAERNFLLSLSVKF